MRKSKKCLELQRGQVILKANGKDNYKKEVEESVNIKQTTNRQKKIMRKNQYREPRKNHEYY